MGGRGLLKNRMAFTPRRSVRDVRRFDPTSGDRIGAEDAQVGPSEAWRTLGATNSSPFFDWFVLRPRREPTDATGACLENWIYFQDQAWELDARARATLHQKVPLFQANPALRIVIGGIASQPGTLANGMKLGLRRVQSIRSYLVAHGIDPDRVGIAIRGTGWFLTEGPGGPDGLTDIPHSGWRLQVTDPHWVLARN